MLQVHVPGAVVKLIGTHADVCSSIDETKNQVLERVQKQLEDHKANLATELIRVSEFAGKTNEPNIANTNFYYFIHLLLG